MNAIVQTQQNFGTNFLTPNSLDEAMKIAELLAGSDIVPKDYQRKPGNILVALQWGAEIGLQPLQALQNIACINGRPAIWGDAALALVRSSGLLEEFEEVQTATEATCTVKRKGDKKACTVTFTMEDAKKAGLSGKQGPWTQYPKRMMQMRARAFALRDTFTDILKGMAIAEEERDKEIDVTPTAIAPETKDAKANSGTSSLKARLAKNKQTVESTVKEIDLKPYYQRIEQCSSFAELTRIGEDIAALNLGEPAKTEIGNVYKEKRETYVSSIIIGLEAAESIEQLNAVLETEFEPYTSALSKINIEQINSVYERREAELTP